MKYLLLACAFCVLLTSIPVFTFAQEKNETTESNRDIRFGSHVLEQKGDEDYCYKNEAYFYEKVWAITGASKDALYKRVRKWLESYTGAEISRINYDDSDKNAISSLIIMSIKNKKRNNMVHEEVVFRFACSSKEGKLRVQGSEYRYKGGYDNGMQPRTVATGRGNRIEYHRDANEYDFPLHDLRPL